MALDGGQHRLAVSPTHADRIEFTAVVHPDHL
jgi:hypothetical protein